MFNTFFEIAFEDFYTKWVIRQLSLCKESDTFFEGLNTKSTIKDFITFLEKMKNNIAIQEKFSQFYNKEFLKSFILYLYENVKCIQKNKKERKQKDYDLIWLCHFFNSILTEYYLDIEEYKKEMVENIKSSLFDLEVLKKEKNSLLTDEDIKRLIKENLEELNKVKDIQKIDFVINGKYSNSELLFKLLSKKEYLSSLPNSDIQFSLYKEDFYNIFNYPLKDYLLYMMYLK